VYYTPRTLRVLYQASADSVLVDADTARHVELLAPSIVGISGGGNRRGPARSLLAVVNRCQTPGGIRQLRANLFQPLTAKEAIEARLDAVEELIKKPGVFHALQALVGRFSDVDRLLSLCSAAPKRMSDDQTAVLERRLNNAIGLRQSLELVEPLKEALSCTDTELLSDMYDALQDPRFGQVLEKVS